MFPILAERLLLARRRAGISQNDVKDRTGLATSTISSYEKGRSEPHASALIKLSQCYGVSAHYLLGLESSSSSLNTDGLDDTEVALVEEIIEIIRRAKGYPHMLKIFNYTMKAAEHSKPLRYCDDESAQTLKGSEVSRGTGQHGRPPEDTGNHSDQ